MARDTTQIAAAQQMSPRARRALRRAVRRGVVSNEYADRLVIMDRPKRSWLGIFKSVLRIA